jgi:hypothetical protein
MRRLPLISQLFPASHYALLGLLFFVGLEVIFSIQRWIYGFITILILLMIVGVVLVRLEEGQRFKPNQLVLPFLALTGLIGFSFFLREDILRHVYFVLATLLLFWLLKHGSKQAFPTWNWTIATVILFLNLAVVLGLHFQQLLPLLPTLIISWLVSFLICLQAIRRIAPRLSEAVLVALAVALALTEIVWVLQFLPLRYIVPAGVVVTFYYIFFNTIRLSYERTLVRRDLWEYGTIGAIALIIILATTRWI